eukprot:1108500-Alexandrium_andersonii.AAC.1
MVAVKSGRCAADRPRLAISPPLLRALDLACLSEALATKPTPAYAPPVSAPIRMGNKPRARHPGLR